jgi:HSP20 family protein
MKNALMPWRKTDEERGLFRFQDAMNDLFESFGQFPEWPAFMAPNAGAAWSPRLDVIENEKELQVIVDLPGLEEKDVDVSLTGDVLTIKGQTRVEKEEKGKTFHRLERMRGYFQRAMTVPFDVDRSNVRALFNRGVLTVTLPKSPAAQEMACRIPVKAG